MVSGEPAYLAPYGVMSPAQAFAMKVMRFMHEHRIDRCALRAIAMASYHHAQANQLAIMYGRPLDAATYDASRWIVEPFVSSIVVSRAMVPRPWCWWQPIAPSIIRRVLLIF